MSAQEFGGMLSDAGTLHHFLKLLQALNSELREHNRAICELDISQVQQRLASEHDICTELSCLFPRVENTMRSMGRIRSEAPPGTEEQLRLLCGSICTSSRELSYALRVHLALTLRSRRSMRALTNVLSSFSAHSPENYSRGVNFGASYGN